MAESASRTNGLLAVAYFLLISLALTSCGTLEIAPVEPAVTSESPIIPATTTAPAELTPFEPSENVDESELIQAVAWYGTIHSLMGGELVADYFKPWHLSIWPKFGPAVGISGASPSTDAEIGRLRDTDTKVTLWGRLSCEGSSYGPCEILVTRLSASDGGPSYAPDQVESWEGTVGRMPAQPGSQNDTLYFVLVGEVPVLYGIAGIDRLVQDELERLPETGATVRIWGEVQSKVQPVTGTVINVERLEVVGQP